MEKMKPCWHCEEKELLEAIETYVAPEDEEEPVHFVQCHKCYAFGPICDTEAEAIAAWNTRPREPQWISVEDRLPMDLKPVLVKGESDNHIRKGFDVCWRYDGDWQTWHVRNITHWQPLPMLPESEENHE